MTEVDHLARSSHAENDNGRSNQNQPEDPNRARQAAEALFAPKQRAAEPEAVTSPDQTTRKPRILSAAPAKPVQLEPASVAPNPESSDRRGKIPAAHLDRVRTWLKYGMNISQIAELYAMTPEEVQSALKIG
jgi:hypothetical protein